MEWGARRRLPWWALIGAIVGLLVAVAAGGVLGFVLNRNVADVSRQALGRDLRLEDLSDELRFAVLNVKYRQYRLMFPRPTRDSVEDFDAAYRDLLSSIDRLEGLDVGEPDLEAPRLRGAARVYYSDLRPAISAYDSRPQRFASASERGLVRINRLELSSERLDRLAEGRARAALDVVDRTSRQSALILAVVQGGLVLVGAALAYGSVRVLGTVRESYSREREAREQTARSLRVRTDFLADASHELRTPLAILRGNAEVGLAMPGDCEHRELLEDILHEAGRLSRLVDDMLFIARTDSGAPPLQMAEVDVEDWLGTLVEPAGVLVAQRGASFRARLDARGRLRADRGRLDQAVLILVDNAANYSPKGSEVELTAHTWGSQLVVEVRDRGPGISREELPLIFERFYRSRGEGLRQGGAGLGLSIAKRIAEVHGGALRAESIPGEGTTMVLSLPLLGV